MDCRVPAYRFSGPYEWYQTCSHRETQYWPSNPQKDRRAAEHTDSPWIAQSGRRSLCRPFPSGGTQAPDDTAFSSGQTTSYT